MKDNRYLNAECHQRFSIRKSHLGASSVLLGVSLLLLFGAAPAAANELENSLESPPSTVLTTEADSNSVVDKVTDQENEAEQTVTPEVEANQALAEEVNDLETIQMVDDNMTVTLPDTSEEATETSIDEDFSRVSVHDPSIFYDEASGTYYAFGSHLAQAKSDDLQNWAPLFNHEYENPSSVLGNLNENLAKPFEWAGYDDADTANGRYSVWAPDVIWNPAYQWDDGTTGAYMYYFSNSSTWRRSVISYAVSKTVEGPYDYVDSLIYSGFTKEDATDGSSRNVNYKNTNVDDLMEAGVIESGFSDKWNRDNGHTYNNDYAPNAIDANVFYDKTGKLYMSYGSWSGGIYLLEIDPTTGKAIYPGKDSMTPDGRHIDKYFGTHLIGSWHQSGEAPYITYDPSTDFYYLFVTYGGLGREGGYNMRLFRSKTVDGLYVDAKGEHPKYTGWTPNPINAAYGVKVMGNYSLDSLKTSYMSPGHNSAFIDKDGNWFLVNHTRFNQGTEYHEVRVHPMKMTEDGWPVALPFEYRPINVALTERSVKQFSGDYEFVNHGTETSGQPLAKSRLQLNDDGSVSGALTGNWTVTEKSGHFYVTLITDSGTTYQGIFELQKDESPGKKVSLVFALVGNNNEVIWGVKPYEVETKSTIKIHFLNEKNAEILPTQTIDGFVGETVALPEVPFVEGYHFETILKFVDGTNKIIYRYQSPKETLNTLDINHPGKNYGQTLTSDVTGNVTNNVPKSTVQILGNEELSVVLSGRSADVSHDSEKPLHTALPKTSSMDSMLTMIGSFLLSGVMLLLKKTKRWS
ncbi:glycoside hydrolase family 43 protein [Streptococcus sp. S784/96/1]|uniref:glycoside hydrolase family 43 protein n=1 Tax=Streptococcus sp. S784/96/1 TaxID=2653499 RepID=UPI001389D9C5|nr:glycoside hydrolase family 43 protein [Streptococcus sp. S784/96/1]